MTRAGISSDNELARRAKVPQPTVSRILKKESADPTNEVLEKIARALGVRVAHLRGEISIDEPAGTYNVAPGPDVYTVPEVSWVQAGKRTGVQDPYPPGQGRKDIITTRKVGPRAYALRIRGDSMENPAGGKHNFPEGSVIIVDPDRSADAGSFVVVRFDDVAEATFKQLVVDSGQRFLKPLNPRYPMIPIDGNATLCGTWVQTIIDGD